MTTNPTTTHQLCTQVQALTGCGPLVTRPGVHDTDVHVPASVLAQLLALIPTA